MSDLTTTTSRMTLDEIARLVGGTVQGNGTATVHAVAGLEDARPGDLTFLANSRYRGQLRRTQATAVLIAPMDVPDHLTGSSVNLIVVEEPSLAFSQAVEMFSPVRPRPAPGIHPTAVVSEEAELGEDVSIGACVVVEGMVRVGRGSILYPGVYVGPGTHLGEDVVLHPNVVIEHGSILGDRVVVHPGAVIGSDGFGYVLVGNQAIKVPQQGVVELGNDVEVGANTTIDRARFDRTRVGPGSKIDNLCQIAHNVEVGFSSYLAAQAGVAGSSKIGNGVMIGGQAGVSGHLTVGDMARVAAQAGVSRSISDGESVVGFPAMPSRQYWKMVAQSKRIGVLLDRVDELSKRIEELEGNAEDD